MMIVLSVAVLACLGLMMSAAAHMAGGMAWQTALTVHLLRFGLWACAAPVVLRLAERFPFGRKQVIRTSLIHLAWSAVLSLAHTVVFLPLLWMLGRHPEGASLAVDNTLRGVFIYSILLLVAHAVGYYQRYRHEELRAARLEVQLAQAQLMALKMQLNPHFLFNTLNAVSSLVLEDGLAAKRMLARLGDFLRYTLHASSAQKVPLQTELDGLDAYLQIEKCRFEERLSVKFDVDPETLDAQVPNLLLQPIVENAIRHGVDSTLSGIGIEIKTNVRSDALLIQVRDNGPGMAYPEVETKGVGLRNTRARLENLYPGQHNFQIATHPGGGVLVEIQIPFEPAAVASPA
ncbi:MAG TPA: histidine kinase [Bryobacteraceae bacterium]|nr:histidine kinase [Bryobacteraceae bacterium]